MTGNPVVTLNRAVAAAMADGPAAGLAILDGLEAQLAGQPRRRRGPSAPARDGRATPTGRSTTTAAAARLTTNLAEQRHLSMQAARLRAQTNS